MLSEISADVFPPLIIKEIISKIFLQKSSLNTGQPSNMLLYGVDWIHPKISSVAPC
jgi:hypothetical protein